MLSLCVKSLSRTIVPEFLVTNVIMLCCFYSISNTSQFTDVTITIIHETTVKLCTSLPTKLINAKYVKWVACRLDLLSIEQISLRTFDTKTTFPSVFVIKVIFWNQNVKTYRSTTNYTCTGSHFVLPFDWVCVATWKHQRRRGHVSRLRRSISVLTITLYTITYISCPFINTTNNQHTWIRRSRLQDISYRYNKSVVTLFTFIGVESESWNPSFLRLRVCLIPLFCRATELDLRGYWCIRSQYYYY